MRERPRIVTLLLALSVFVLSGGCTRPTHPTDEELTAQFHEHRAEFDSLVAMFNADDTLYKVTLTFTLLDDDSSWPRPPGRLGISERRWDDYRERLQVLGLRGGIKKWASKEGVVLLASSLIGFLSDGSEKGFAYSCEPVSPVIDHLPADPRSLPHGQTQFVPLDECWYLYASCR